MASPTTSSPPTPSAAAPTHTQCLSPSLPTSPAPKSKRSSIPHSVAASTAQAHAHNDLPLPDHEQEPDARVDEIMQHPLWAQRGSQRLSSQDMEKHFSLEYRSHRDDEIVRDQRHAEAAVRKDIGALFSLMLVTPFVGIALTFYGIVGFLLVTLASPVLLLVSGPAALKHRYLSVLLPALNLHYRMAYSSRRCRPEAPSNARSWPGSVSLPESPSSSGFSDMDEKLSPTPGLAWLMTVLVFSPLLSLPIALANFTIMFFWFMSAVTESASKGSSMDDGRMMAKRVRRFWVRWLSGELSQRSQRKRRPRPISRV